MHCTSASKWLGTQIGWATSECIGLHEHVQGAYCLVSLWESPKQVNYLLSPPFFLSFGSGTTAKMWFCRIPDSELGWNKTGREGGVEPIPALRQGGNIVNLIHLYNPFYSCHHSCKHLGCCCYFGFPFPWSLSLDRGYRLVFFMPFVPICLPKYMPRYAIMARDGFELHFHLKCY